MNFKAIRVLVATLAISFALERSCIQFAIAQGTGAQPNEFVDKLKKLVEQTEQREREDALKYPNLPRGVDIAKYYNYQIKNAEELIAAGGTFGNDEFQSAMKAATFEISKAIERYKMEAIETGKKQSEDADRKYAESVMPALEQHKAIISSSNEKYRVTVEALNLKEQFRTSGGEIGIVIWNLPMDQNLHQRLATFVDVQLFNGNQAVWGQKNLKLDRKVARNLVRLPSVLFDRVVIGLPRWSGRGSGLAEVEVFVGKHNVALNRPCDVSSIETQPIHLDDQHALTDGISEPTQMGDGYWIPEENTKASVSIHLLGKKIERPKAALAK